MDTHDVSEDREYWQYLRRQKQTLQNAQSRKGQRPKTTKSRDEIIMQFMFRRMMSSNATVDSKTIRSSFVPPAYAPCTAPLRSLKKVVIKDLTLETHHRGSYILLRAVTPPDTMTAVMVIVEDEEGDVLMLQLYNQEEGLSAQGRLIEGTVIIVKEPYLKAMSDGDYGIRVDHLPDVRFIPDHDTLIPSSWRRQLMENDASANYWKLKGNDCFNKANYHVAVDCYSKALGSSPTLDEAITIKLNRALTFLKTHQFDVALRDLKIVSTGSKPSEKVLFRKAQALYYLQRFRESCDAHQVLAKEFPSNAPAKSEFNRAIARLAEQESGKYPFKRLQLEAKKRRPPVLDHATYVGPVAVRPADEVYSQQKQSKLVIFSFARKPLRMPSMTPTSPGRASPF
ncbi:TPR domain protein [Aspergillus fischeri NRRL 181]|uniref:TPR domain protein n=1 Tax=Neosartorya fischeri (strain ATCC 1020 / DSM 3700 / CBS 544.65 / FGSC A1164 / JCM 1740 / NRRL 181 / WB 181) TaxID=331117 RepID=A1D0R2_NEOFI|nr:TPR domain protein [Aspergillus fischeri NRRL 181]EAW24582.1 TPR domain protein [Aspergillus fischeri NRRL 181]